MCVCVCVCVCVCGRYLSLLRTASNRPVDKVWRESPCMAAQSITFHSISPIKHLFLSFVCVVLVINFQFVSKNQISGCVPSDPSVSSHIVDMGINRVVWESGWEFLPGISNSREFTGIPRNSHPPSGHLHKLKRPWELLGTEIPGCSPLV